jgi:hypothetical protein
LGKRAAAIAFLLSLSFLGSLLALALVGERHVVGNNSGTAASPLPPGVDAPPVQVDVPRLTDGSHRPGIGGRPVAASPPARPEGGQSERPQHDQAPGTPPDAEPPPPATEPLPQEQPPAPEVESDDGTTHLKAGGEDQDDGNTRKKEKGGQGGGKDHKVKEKGKSKGNDTPEDEGSGKGKGRGSEKEGKS